MVRFLSVLAVAAVAVSCSSKSQTKAVPASGGSGGASGASGAGGSSGSAGTSGSGGASGASGSGGASGASGSAGTAGSAGAAGSGGTSNDLAALSDEFPGAALAPKWTVTNSQLLIAGTPSVANSQLRLTPGNSVWFNTMTGPLLHQNVTGDFHITTLVQVTRADGSPLGPLGTHWAGLMIRSPSGPPEDHLHIVIGRNNMGDSHITLERSSANEGVTDYSGATWSAGPTAELRICRVSDQFRLYQRAVGTSTWNFHHGYLRPDLPAQIQAGPVAHAWNVNPDLRAEYEYVRYQRVTSQADCTVD